MATKKVVELECDLCDTKLQVAKGDYTAVGWTELLLKSMTFNAQGTLDIVKFEICPQCLKAIANTINERSQ